MVNEIFLKLLGVLEKIRDFATSTNIEIIIILLVKEKKQ